jgi:uncharacterized protein (DUF885 family)
VVLSDPSDSVATVGRLDEIADRYVDEWAALEPIGATYVGVAGLDDKLTDYSPEGFAARAELDRRTLAEIDPIEPADERERVAKEAMAERLGLALEMYEAGEATSELNVISSPLHGIRSIFDLMPLDGEVAAANVAARLAGTPAALAGWKRALRTAADAGHVVARMQMVEVAKQCDIWVDAARDNFFLGLAERVKLANPDLSAGLAADLDRGAAAAREATADIARFLRGELVARGRANPAAGLERYRLNSRNFLGDSIDFTEAYEWGFDELARLEAEMRTVADKIVPGGTVDEAVIALDADPARNLTGKDEFQRWMQDLADQAVAELNGAHFDIPEPVRRIECCIAPTSDGSIYYTGPSEDFARAGQMWWAVPEGIETFSTWREVTTVYHEGVPGHHLQVGQTAYRAELLNRWQRLLCWVSGHGEGWALYAERLMDELGYLSDPGDKLGMLDAQTFRAARVIVDLGMHLELEIPRDNPFGFHPGERWTPEHGWEFMRAHCRIPDENLRFELNRYLGWPGQAPAYKIGERTWLRARDDAKLRQGAAFDLRAFHRDALNLGSLGLGVLERAVARL